MLKDTSTQQTALSEHISVDTELLNDARLKTLIEELFPNSLIKLLEKALLQFADVRDELLQARSSRQNEWDQGKLPEYLDKKSQAVSGTWKVAPIPEDLKIRRVEITGPISDPKMVINMLSRNSEGHRADTAMLDFEDSMKPSFENVLNGFKNLIGAALRNLSYQNPENNKTYQLNPQDMAKVMVRVRGLHLAESHFYFKKQEMPAGFFDLITSCYHVAKIFYGRGESMKFYVPKCEHHLEARLWNQVMNFIEDELSLPRSTIRATFLIETLPAAFQIEEILYEGKEHIVGLNVGRWDKIFSDIKVLGKHKDRISADRASITMQKPWMENYAKRLIKITHERGAYAIGGMSAFTPGKDAETRNRQTQKVVEDKSREFELGHDGCWVSHPYFIGYALGAFTKNNQLDKKLPEMDRYPDLLMKGEGPRTLNGLRTNLRVGIAYLEAWQNNIGCVAWDNLMEDLATLEISRSQTWQWLYHEVKLDSGEIVNESLVKKTFNEELERILGEVPSASHESFKRAKENAQNLFLMKEMPPFLTNRSKD